MFKYSRWISLCLPFALALPTTGIAAEEEDMVPELEAITIFGVEEDFDRISGSAHRVEEETLEEYQYDDINRVLNQVPGVYVREEDGYGLRPNIGLRGGSSDRSQKVTLMEDGVLFGPAPYSAPAAYYFPLTTRMTGVEVFKGPSAIQYGPQTIGGAINLISAPIPDEFAGMFEVAGGSDDYRRVHGRIGTTQGPLGLSAEFVHLESSGFKELDGGGDTGFDKDEIVLKGAYNIGPGTLRLRLGYADEVSDETYLGLTESDFRDNPNRRYRASANDQFDSDWRGARLGWTQPLWGGNLDVVGYVQSFDRTWNRFNGFGNNADIRDVLANPDDPLNSLLYDTLTGARDSDPNTDGDDLFIANNAREFLSTGVQGHMNWNFNTGANDRFLHLLQVGVRVHSDRVRRDHDETAFEIASGELQGKDSTRAITADNTGFAEAVAVWARDEILIDNWTIVPGVRIESISTRYTDRLNQVSQKENYTEVLPGLGVSYAWSDSLSLLSGVHKGFSPATPGRDADVEPEEAINYEVGARWNSARFGRFEGIFFYSDYKNLTSVCTFSTGCAERDLDQQINAGQVEIFGLESSWNHAIKLTPKLQIPLGLTYTYTETEFQESFTSVDPQFGEVQEGFELPYIPEHRANARVGLSGQRWGASLSATYQSELRDVAGSGPIAPGEGTDQYTVYDLAMHWDISPGLSLIGRVDNLLDKEYIVSRRPFGARPGLPLTFQLGLNYSF